MAENAPVIIVGAGLAGLACALELQARGERCVVVESADGVGGRVRTDELDGFRLDRGFQVLLTAYPEAQRVLDYEALDLQPFYPGALVRQGGRFARLADPTRKPSHLFKTLSGSVGTFADKWRVLGLRRASRAGSLDALWSSPEVPTHEALKARGFSEAMRTSFFTPFLGGVFLEKELLTSDRMLRFVMRMFSRGDNAVPAEGMGRIPEQMAAGLEPGTVRLNTPVMRVLPGAVALPQGERLESDRIVVAVEGPAASALLAGAPNTGSRMAQCVYFAAEHDPVGEPTLVLDGEGRGPVNNLAVMSTVSRAYAPAGAHLVAASVVGDHGAKPSALVDAVRDQLRGWYGPRVNDWRHLRSYRIPHALPDTWGRPAPGQLPDGVSVAGDWCENPSIQGALASGRRSAEALLQPALPTA